MVTLPLPSRAPSRAHDIQRDEWSVVRVCERLGSVTIRVARSAAPDIEIATVLPVTGRRQTRVERLAVEHRAATDCCNVSSNWVAPSRGSIPPGRMWVRDIQCSARPDFSRKADVKRQRGARTVRLVLM